MAHQPQCTIHLFSCQDFLKNQISLDKTVEFGMIRTIPKIMAHNFINFLKNLSLVLLSSLLLILSFPRFDLGIFAWFGLLPLFIVIHGKRLGPSFFWSLICGIFFFWGIFRWIVGVPKEMLLHHTFVLIYLGSFFGFFGLAFNFIRSRSGMTTAFFAAPFIWVSLEYVRSNLSFLALPWGLLAHSQYRYPSVIQIASLTGTYGISFLIVMVNAALAALIDPSLFHPHPIPPPSRDRVEPSLRGSETTEAISQAIGSKETATRSSLARSDNKRFAARAKIAFVISSGTLLLFSLIYGEIVTSKPITGSSIKISVIQGNIAQEKKWDPRYAQEIMDTYTSLTRQASKDKPVIIIWPETATPGSISLDLSLNKKVRNLAREAEAYLLVGSAQDQKFLGKESVELKFLNSAYLIPPNPEATRNQQYDKIRLFPFGEYLPYKKLPWSLIGISGPGNYLPGKEYTVFELPASRFGVTICWENIFPDLFRQFVRDGAQFMINIINEAHFGKTAAPYQFLSISVFRAVENGVFVVRCANTGVSCMIDPYGRILDRVKGNNGEDIFVRGVMTRWIIPLDSKTIYTKYGDWFVWLAIVGSLLFLGILIFGKKARYTQT